MKKLITLLFLTVISIGVIAAGHTVTIISQTNVTCYGSCNGTASASVAGGLGPFSYSWGTSSSATGICAGTYTLTVTDSSDMSTATANFTITEPTQLVATAYGGSPVCAGQSITMSSSATGGTGSYTYTWSPSMYLSNPNIQYPICTPPSTVTYTLIVTDANGCTAMASATVMVSAPVFVSATATNATCGLCDGQVFSTSSGGSPPYVYYWIPGGATTANMTNLCAGTYTITSTDGNGCSGTAVTTVNFTSNITGISSSVTNATCGNSDGAISINTVNGGTPPFTYSWSPISATTSTITGLTAGTYNLSIYDSLGCSYSTGITVINMNGPTAVSVTTVNSNCTSPTGQINIGAVTGGLAPYSYSLNGSAFSSTVNYTGLSTGTYNLTVQDSNSCPFYTTVFVGNLNPPVITLDSLIHSSCNGGAGGSISINVTGGTPGYTFIWNNGTTTQNITSLPAGLYNVIVTDAAGCSSNQSFFISNSNAVHASVYSSYASCGSTGSATVSAAGGVPPYTYSWNTTPVQNTPTATGLNPGTYVCTITDTNGCFTNVYTWIGAHCYNIIKGRIYNDINGNCVQDAGEPGIAGRNVYSGGSSWGYGYTNTSGDYTIYTTSMNNSVTQTLSIYSSQICPVPPTNQTANFSMLGDTISNVDFADQFISNINDLVVSYYPGVARPGFSQWGQLWYRNTGTTVMNGVTINLAHDSILTYNSSSPASTSYTYPNIGWNIGTLNPGQTGYLYVYFTVPVISSGGYLGRVLHYTAEINPIAGDTTPVNNISNATTAITGSYDPNEKEVSPAGNILVTDSILTYKIQFQNTGTDTAFTIVLKDTLSAYLDPATVEPGIASDPYTFDISFDGELTWTFDNILLVDSTTNEPASHGFATFTVKQRANNPIGTVIDNTAHIYFDFNEAVVTNTVSNTVVDVTTEIETSSTNNHVRVYPNPFSESTTFMIQSDKVNDIYIFQLVDVLGKTVRYLNNITEKQFIISRNGLQNGMYFYNITNAEGVVGKGKIIIK